MVQLSGFIFAVLAFSAWGFIPLFWKLLSGTSAFAILCHRMTWSAIVLAVLLLTTGRINSVVNHLRFARNLRLLACTSLLIGGNWFVFVWAVNTGRTLDASLGYFIAPLLNVVLGRLSLRERLGKTQTLSVCLVALGVGNLTFVTQAVPFTALFLAVSFSFYGLLRKTAAVGSLEGLFVECLFLFLPAVAYLLWNEFDGSVGFLALPFKEKALLALAGPITVIPLYWYTKGARRISLTSLGLLQYIAPSLQFLVAVLLLGEPMDSGRLYSFIVIWSGLVLFSAGSTFERWRN